LVEKLPGKWIEREGQLPWLPLSPDSFVWGYVQSTVTENDDLEKRITDVIMTIRADMLLRTW
jgi:hypothetical protein